MKIPKKKVDIEALARHLHKVSWREQAKLRGALDTPGEVIEQDWNERMPIRAFWVGIAMEAVQWLNATT